MKLDEEQGNSELAVAKGKAIVEEFGTDKEKKRINEAIQTISAMNNTLRYEAHNQIKIEDDLVKEKTKLEQPKRFLETFRNKKINNQIKRLESKRSECLKKLKNITNIVCFQANIFNEITAGIFLRHKSLYKEVLGSF